MKNRKAASALFGSWSDFLRIQATKLGGSLIKYLLQKMVNSCSSVEEGGFELLLCNKWKILETHGEGWRSGFD